MGKHSPQATGAREAPAGKGVGAHVEKPTQRFAIIRDGKLVGLFSNAADAETAISNLTAPSPPGTLKLVPVKAHRLRIPAPRPYPRF
jgi:hypothetical protein